MFFTSDFALSGFWQWSAVRLPLLVFAVFCEASPLILLQISVSLWEGINKHRLLTLISQPAHCQAFPGFVSQKETDILDMHGSVRVGDSFGQRQPWQIVVKSSSTRSNYEFFQYLVSDLWSVYVMSCEIMKLFLVMLCFIFFEIIQICGLVSGREWGTSTGSNPHDTHNFEPSFPLQIISFPPGSWCFQISMKSDCFKEISSFHPLI